MKHMRALSIRQPYAEPILRGTKTNVGSLLIIVPSGALIVDR
jgi:hypothetical protein